MQQFEVVTQDDGEYEVRVQTTEGVVSLTLLLGEAAASSDGTLGSDEATAHATIQYLLEHQGAEDLPQQIDIEEVLAAYPDAVERITSLRG